jgi:hypothetical protein
MGSLVEAARGIEDDGVVLRDSQPPNDPPPHHTPPPIYADRDTGTRFENAFDMVNAYLTRYADKTGIGVETLDATGYAQVKRGSAYIGINVLEDNGVLMMLAPIMEVPFAGRERFYRRLLEISFLQTSDAAFAIDGKKDIVYVRALRRLSSLDYEEFEDLLSTVGVVADQWDDELKKDYGD